MVTGLSPSGAHVGYLQTISTVADSSPMACVLHSVNAYLIRLYVLQKVGVVDTRF